MQRMATHLWAALIRFSGSLKKKEKREEQKVGKGMEKMAEWIWEKPEGAVSIDIGKMHCVFT